MHELSIALNIVDIAAEEGRRRGLRVTGVHVRLGALSGVIKEALESAWDLACDNSPITGARLVITHVPISVDCPVCRCEQPAESIQQLCCGVCGTPAGGVVHGKEMEVTAVEVDE